MTREKFRRKCMCFLFGMWFAITLTQPVTAQWTVHINSDTSPTTFQMISQMAQQLAAQTSIAADAKASKIAQALEYVKTAQRWIQTVEQYTTKIIGDIRRFTSMKGILSTVEKQLGLSDDTLKALRDIGDLIRGAFTLKNNFLSLVRTRLSMIQSLEDRARRGIFNPEADLRDLEEYLRYSVGREAGIRLATREKLAEIDPLIEKLTFELSQVRAERAAAQKELDEIYAQIGRENALGSRPRVAGVDGDGNSTTVFNDSRQSLSPEAMQTLTIRRGQLEQQIRDLIAQEQSLVNELQARYEEIQKNYKNAYLKGRYWDLVNKGWLKFDEEKERQMQNLIDTYGTAEPSGTPIIPQP